MRAWQFFNPQRPLALVEIHEPTPAEGEVVLDIKAAGLCHSDVTVMEGPGMAWLKKTPVVLGHEVAGVVTRLGPGVTEVKLGDRVGLVWGGSADDCPGVSRDGGYAEKTIGKVGFMVPIPDEVTFEQAAAGTDAGMSSHSAVTRAAGVKRGDRVGIIGLGGLGLTGARIAVLKGAKVYAAEPKRHVWPKALELGVKECFADVREFAPLNLDTIIDFAGAGITTAGAISAVRTGGRVVQVGHAVSEATIPMLDLIFKQVHLVGSVGGTSEDIAAVYALVASGRLSPTISIIGFEEIPEGLERLKAGRVEGRLVAHVSD